MPKEVDPSSWEFAKYALQRNDEAIRFSETKAALLLTITGLILAFVVDKILLMQSFYKSQPNIIKILTIISMALILFGIVIVTIASLLAIFPRRHVTKEISLLYFENISKISEQELARQFSILDSSKKTEHIISQIHATSVIANRKFRLICFGVAGTTLIVIGSISAILIFSFN